MTRITIPIGSPDTHRGAIFQQQPAMGCEFYHRARAIFQSPDGVPRTLQSDQQPAKIIIKPPHFELSLSYRGSQRGNSAFKVASSDGAPGLGHERPTAAKNFCVSGDGSQIRQQFLFSPDFFWRESLIDRAGMNFAVTANDNSLSRVFKQGCPFTLSLPD